MDKLGKYEILEKIGEGGFGAVFKARDPLLKRIVALKTCTHDDPNVRRRFLREGEIVASLQHPNITLIHDLGFEGGTPFLVQEFLTGIDFIDIIERRSNYDEPTRVGWLVSVARGLEYAHGRGIVHRDIKPANVRLQDDGSIKIMDFGIAKLAQHETRLTRSGMAVGTIAYMSPEQLDGSEVDQRADIFAFGVLAYEILTYTRPFDGRTMSRLVQQILHDEPRGLDRLSRPIDPGLEQIVRRCLAKAREDRFQSATELLKAFDRQQSGLPPIEASALAGSSGRAASSRGDPAISRSDSEEAVLPAVPGSSERGQRIRGRRWHSALDPVPARWVRGGVARAAVVVVGALAVGAAIWVLAGRFQRNPPAAPAPAASSELRKVPVASEPSVGTEPPAAVPPPAAAPPAAVTAAEVSPVVTPAAPAPSAGKRAPREGSSATGEVRQGGAREKEQALGAAAVPSTVSETPPAARSSPAPSDPPPAISIAEAPAAAPESAPVPPAPDATVAVADPAPSGEVEIRRLLADYVEAYESLDAGAVVAVVPSLATRRGELARAFAQYRSLDVQLEGCRIEIAADRATASCGQRQSIELKVGQARAVERRVRFRLSRHDGRWAIEAVEG